MRDGTESDARPEAEFIDGLNCLVLRRKEDDQLLCIRGDLKRLAGQLKLTAGGMIESEDSAFGNHVTVHAPGEVGTCELCGEPLGVLDRWSKPQVECLLVCDVVPVGEERTGAGVGEDIAREVRSLAVEQSGSTRHQLTIRDGLAFPNYFAAWHDGRPLDPEAPGYAKTMLNQLAWWAGALRSARRAAAYPV